MTGHIPRKPAMGEGSAASHVHWGIASPITLACPLGLWCEIDIGHFTVHLS